MEINSKLKTATAALSFQESRWDGILGLLCMIFGIAGLRLSNDSNLWNTVVRKNETLVRVGNLVWKNGEIRLKPDGSFLWHDIQPGSN